MPNAEMKVNAAYLQLLEDKTRIHVLKGGAGSGKSVFEAQKSLFRITTEKNIRGLVIRKVGNTLRESVWKLLKDLIHLYGIQGRFNITDGQMRMVDKITGSEILCKGLDDPEKIKSVTGLSFIWMEEATEFSEADFNQLDLRLRGKTGGYKQISLTFNPIDTRHWTKRRFFDDADKETLSISTTYKDNLEFLDREYIDRLENRMAHDENLYRIYVKGEWGLPSSGNEFYRSFKISKHVKSGLAYDATMPLHISFDFNVMPYVTALVFQFSGKKVRLISEIALPHPNNNTTHVCRKIITVFSNHTGGVFIYGDASGKAQDTRSEKGQNDYTLIDKELRALKPRQRVPALNPPVSMRGQFINYIFASEFDDIEVLIDESCKVAIDDLTYLKEASDGTKLKKRVKDEITGGTYEEYGHASDAWDYFFCEAFKDSFIKFQKGDKTFVLRTGKTVNKNTY